jgi:hypothetical protein
MKKKMSGISRFLISSFLLFGFWNSAHAQSFVTLYTHKNFQGKQKTLSMDRNNEDKIQSLNGTGFDDRASSIRCDLEDGITVVLYEHSDRDGRALILTGRNQDDDLRNRGMGDKISAWKWFGAPQLNSVYIYEHICWGGKRYAISVVDGHSENSLFSLGGTGLHDKMSSIRYYLEPNLFVTFFEHNNGSGRRYTVPPLHRGEIGGDPNLHNRNFGDCASAWKWIRP